METIVLNKWQLLMWHKLNDALKENRLLSTQDIGKASGKTVLLSCFAKEHNATLIEPFPSLAKADVIKVTGYNVNVKTERLPYGERYDTVIFDESINYFDVKYIAEHSKSYTGFFNWDHYDLFAVMCDLEYKYSFETDTFYRDEKAIERKEAFRLMSMLKL